jgi:hypothetical protein
MAASPSCPTKRHCHRLESPASRSPCRFRARVFTWVTTMHRVLATSAVLVTLTSCLTATAAARPHADQPHARSAATTNIYASYSKVGYARSSGSRWNVYEGYSKVGYLSQSGSQWNVYEGYSKVGYTRRSGDRWNCYADYSKIGYSRQSSGTRWNIYADYSRVGDARGQHAGPVGCAALLLGLV